MTPNIKLESVKNTLKVKMGIRDIYLLSAPSKWLVKKPPPNRFQRMLVPTAELVFL